MTYSCLKEMDEQAKVHHTKPIKAIIQLQILFFVENNNIVFVFNQRRKSRPTVVFFNFPRISKLKFKFSEAFTV